MHMISQRVKSNKYKTFVRFMDEFPGVLLLLPFPASKVLLTSPHPEIIQSVRPLIAYGATSVLDVLLKDDTQN